MEIKQAKIICLAHIEYVMDGTPTDYTPAEVGIAIDKIISSIENNIDKYNLIKNNLWRRGNLEDYPNDTLSNMFILNKYS